MGIYLNGISPYSNYIETVRSNYFVDKSNLIKELSEILDTNIKYICMTRPRRFGKTVMANMLAAYYSKGADASEIFNKLDISKSPEYEKHLNSHNVIHIDFSYVEKIYKTYDEYIENILSQAKDDLHETYPEVKFRKEGSFAEGLTRVFTATSEKFIFILDEWDSVFRQSFMTPADADNHLLFLKSLLKDRAYVSLAYMTGVLPISKYSSGSELNMFREFKMTSMELYSGYYGFNDAEVDNLFERYIKNCEDKKVTRKITRVSLKDWYDGYYTVTGERLYNPRSVVCALEGNQTSNYWTTSGPYDEVFYYIKNNIDDSKNDVTLMLAGEGVRTEVDEYSATSTEISNKEEMYSAMVVYGLLTYWDGKVMIPNRELMLEYTKMARNKESLGYVHRLAKISGRMLEATLNGDVKTMEEMIGHAHDTEGTILKYNHETELAAIINLVYLAARDKYRVEREEKSGKGFVDMIYYPIKPSEDAIVIELKVNGSPEAAISQIKEKKYAQRFQGKLGEEPAYTGRILAVGIGYQKTDKVHRCLIEEL